MVTKKKYRYKSDNYQYPPHPHYLKFKHKIEKQFKIKYV